MGETSGAKPARCFGLSETEVLNLLELMRTWARWANSIAGASRGSCGSAERLFVAPRPDEEKLARQARGPLDVIDAENVETALSALRSPVDRQFLIHRHQYHGAAFEGAPVARARALRLLCGRFGLAPAELDGFHLRCLAELKANLQQVEQIRRVKGVRVIYTEALRLRR